MKPVKSEAEPIRQPGPNDFGRWVKCTDGTWVMVDSQALSDYENWRPQHWDRPSVWARVKGYFGGDK